MECRERSFLCSMPFPLTIILVTIEMTLLGKGKYFPSPESQGIADISQILSILVLHLTLSGQRGRRGSRGETDRLAFHFIAFNVHRLSPFPFFLAGGVGWR